MQYIFRIDDFEIHRTRALRADTDLVGLLLRVGDHTYPPVMISMGDVGDGKHAVNAEIGPIDVPNDATPVVVSYSIVNSGGSSEDLKSQIKFVLNAFADAGGQNVPFGIGSLINDFLMFPFHNFEFASCDGIVAMDAIASNGQTLSSLTGDGTGYSETRRYPGRLSINTPEYKSIYPSPGACGETSDYSVTWSVKSVPAGSGQRELVRRPGVVSIAGYSTVDAVQHVIIGIADPPAGGSISSISISDGGIVHENQEPQGSINGLSALAAYDGGLAQYVIAISRMGNLTFVTAPVSSGGTGGTTFEPVPLAPIPGVVALAGFINLGFHNIFIGMDDGTIRYLVRNEAGSWADRGQISIGSGQRLAGLASYVAERDGYAHIATACDNGDVLDVRVSPDAGMAEPVFQDVRANISRPIAVTAYFGPDNYHHLYVASEDGNIHEIWFPGSATGGQGGVSVRAGFSNILTVTAYFGLDDNEHHLVAASRDGRILATSWRN